MSTTIRVTWVRRAGMYRIDEVDGGGVVPAEISPAVIPDEAFAEHLAALVAGYRGLGVSRGAVDDDDGGAVVLEWGRRRGPQKQLSGSSSGAVWGPHPGGLEQLAGAGS